MTASSAPVTLASRAARCKEVLGQEVGNEVVLLDLAGEHYYGLNPVGARIWTLLPEAANLAAVLDTLCAEFDAPRERIETDLLALVESLREAGLISVT